MNLIKLDAIDSTNDFLKGLSKDENIENFTVVTANCQTNGKGQMGAKWISEIGKNLTVSVLIKNIISKSTSHFELNVAIALSLLESLNSLEIPNLSIKWPNDIMSDNKKIAGILIENILKSDGSVISIIGFGLNVNQTSFENLVKASSLKLITKKDYNHDLILGTIIETIKKNILQIDKSDLLWENYNNLLFKKGVIMPFENKKGNKFMGIIQEVSRNGKLKLLLENDIIEQFDVKEITMLY